MEDLKNFNIHDLFYLIGKSDEEFLEWLRERKLIWTTSFCECGKEMTKLYKNDRKWPLWRCNGKKNHEGKQPTKGFFDGTFFAGAHLSPKQVFEFTYYWARKTHSLDEFQHDMGIGCPQTVVDWKMFCRDIAAAYFLNHPEKIGFVFC